MGDKRRTAAVLAALAGAAEISASAQNIARAAPNIYASQRTPGKGKVARKALKRKRKIVKMSRRKNR